MLLHARRGVGGWCILGLLIINLVMKEGEKSARRGAVELRKHSISEKTRPDNCHPQQPRDEGFSLGLTRGMKSLGRKYMQQNVFKCHNPKEHHEIVISDEVVRNSKLYRMLREKMEMKDALFVKECNELAEMRSQLRQEVTEVKSSSYHSKLALWELKNQILELKGVLNEEEQELKRLQNELARPSTHYYPNQEEDEDEHQQQQEEEHQLRMNSDLSNEDDPEMDIRIMMSEFGQRIQINPELEDPSKSEDEDQDHPND